MRIGLTLLMISLPLTLSSCALLNTSAPANDYCLIAKPMTYSDNDTEDTQVEIAKYDLKGQKLCGWK